MHKHRIIELLARKMAGEATSHELEELAELMGSFPDSVYYDELLKQFWHLDHQSQLPDSEIAFERHLLRHEEDFARPPQASVSRKIGRYKVHLAAAILLLTVVGSALVYYKHRNSLNTTIEIVSVKGMRKKISLPDGSVVWLNSDSKLSYDANIRKSAKRIVHLKGEAFFQVAHQKSQPFIVKTDKMSIKVLGTSFNVKAYPDEKSEATLINGSIELSINKRPEQKILLNPSEKFALVQQEKVKDITLVIQQISPVKIGDKEYVEETSWKESQLIFKNETFEELRPKLERWFNVKIEFQTAEAQSHKFTGIFEHENIMEALTALQLIKPFNFKIKAYDVIIY